jgi:GTP cyclohydrolase I
MKKPEQDAGSKKERALPPKHAAGSVPPASMPDMQRSRDTRNIAIDKVGVKDIRYPIVVLDRSKVRQQTVARINMYVDLPHHFKGTHMSRFIEILNQHHGEVSVEGVDQIVHAMKEHLEASCAHLELEFPYFIEKAAPVSGARSLMEYQCRMTASLGDEYDFVLGVTVPVTTLCPCSREISVHGAHNQRSAVKVEIRYREHVWLEELIAWVEACGSAPVYALLKREDEKALTEQAYANPMFVEDVVRAVTEALSAVPAITWFRVECENFESIHNHSAYALVEREFRPGRGKPCGQGG